MKKGKEKIKMVKKAVIIGGFIGFLWGIISLILWIMTSGGPTSGANPPISFVILTLPASIPILISYYFIDLPGTLIIFLIPLLGTIMGVLVGYLYNKVRMIQ